MQHVSIDEGNISAYLFVWVLSTSQAPLAGAVARALTAPHTQSGQPSKGPPAAPRAARGRKRAGALLRPISCAMEANKASALELVARARVALADGLDAEASRLLGKSLRMWDSDEGRALREHILKFGPGSPAAAAVSRILKAGTSWYRVMNVKENATPVQIRKAYKRACCRLDRPVFLATRAPAYSRCA